MASCSRSKSQCVGLSWSNSFASKKTKNMFGFLKILRFVDVFLNVFWILFQIFCLNVFWSSGLLVAQDRSDKEYHSSKKSYCAAMGLELQCNNALEVSNAAIPSALQRKMLRCFNFFTVQKNLPMRLYV